VQSCSAPAQLGVEVLQHLGGDLAHRHVAERGLDVLADVGLVALPGVVLDLVYPQPGVQRGTEGRSGPGLLLGVDLGPQAGQDPLGLGLVGGGLGQVHPLPGERVETGVDEDLERVAAPPDRPARTLSATTPGHGRSILAVRVIDSDLQPLPRTRNNAWSTRADAGTRTPNLPLTRRPIRDDHGIYQLLQCLL
jgi:hypothetical protein